MNLSQEHKFEKLKEARERCCRENEVFLREFKIKERMSTMSERHRRGLSELKDLEAKDAGVDVERLKSLTYSLQDVQDWERRSSEKTSDSNLDYGIRAWASYSSLVENLKSDPQKNGKESIRSLAATVDAKRKKVSKRRKFDDEQDYSFINLRNQKFNQKLERAFEIYTANIRDGLEQGS